MRRYVGFFALLLIAISACLPALAQQDIISTVIGGGPNDYPAVDANLNQPDAVAADSAGNFYISAFGQNRIFKVDTKGILTVFVGQGIPGYAGDGVKGGATQALINGPQGLTVDAAGNLYFSDYNNCAVRKVDTANTLTTIAGIGTRCGFGGDGGKGTLANLNFPVQVALDSAGANLYIADMNNCRVRKLTLKNDIINTYAGDGTCGFSGDGGPALSAELNGPDGVTVDSTGNVFIADTRNVRIREVTVSNKKINTVAGNGTSGCNGDGNPAVNANITTVVELSVSSDGKTVTYPDLNCQKIRQFTVGGNITTVAGNGTACFGPCGDGGSALSAEFDNPQGIAASGAKTFLVADINNNRVREFTVGGNINGVAGNGSPTVPTLLNGIAPSGVVLNNPYGVIEDASGNIFFGDTSNQMVRELVKSTDLVDFFAGNGVAGFSGDGGPATKAQLFNPKDVASDSSGNVYIADQANQVIRKVDTAGKISTFAGTPGQCRFEGDGGPATSAFLCNPTGIFVDKSDSVYVADESNHVVRKITSGIINTIAGIGGHCTYGGDGGLAINAYLCNPTGVAVDGQGNVFIADMSNCRIREVSALSGIINTVAGTSACGWSGDGPATQELISSPNGVTVDGSGNLFIADTNNQLVRWVDTSGNMTTFAGNRNCTFSGDGVLATTSAFCFPTGVFVDPSGNYLIADQSNFRIRGVSAFAALNLSNSNLTFPLTSVGQTSSPQTVTLTALGPLSLVNLQVNGDFSEADNCPSNLPNGTSCTMYVYFSPTISGAEVGNVTINHNGFFNPTSIVNLSGTGTAMSISGSPVNFGNQLVKTTSATKTVTLTNTGSSAITMGTISLNETTDFAIASNNCPAKGKPLAAGASCKLGLTFSPQSTGAKKGAVVINDSDPTSPQVVGLSGTGISNVVLSPSSVNFGNVEVGIASAVSSITLINTTGGNITLGNPAVTVTGDFLISKGKTTCTNGLHIANGGNCVIGVQFKPTKMFFRSGTLSVADSDPTSPQTAALSGTGIAIGFNPATENFGTVTVGQEHCVSDTVSNNGTSAVTITGINVVGANSADFTSGTNTGNCPASLAAGTNCNIQVCFIPSKAGKRSATFELFDNSLGSPQKLPLTGTGQ